MANAPVDPIRRARRVRAHSRSTAAEETCEHCGHPEIRHYVDGSCEMCSRCDFREDDDDEPLPPMVGPALPGL